MQKLHVEVRGLLSLRGSVGATSRGVAVMPTARVRLAQPVHTANVHEEATDQAGGGRRQALPRGRTFVSFVRNPDRTPPAQDIQLEASPEYGVAGNLVVAAHLRVCGPLFTA